MVCQKLAKHQNQPIRLKRFELKLNEKFCLITGMYGFWNIWFFFSGISQNPGNVKLNQCEECGLYFIVRRLLHSHIKSVHPEKYSFNFTCYVCGKRFKSKGKLNVHMSTHMFVKPHSCPFCKKQFSDSSNLKTHMHIHTGKFSSKGVNGILSINSFKKLVWLFSAHL